MPTLFHYHDCPYCFRVRAFLAEREVKYASNLVERGHPPPELYSLTPLGKLPVWVTDKGRPVFGSRTIIRFVDRLAEGTPLIPADPLAEARVAMAEDLVDEALLPPMLKLDREIGGKPAEEWNMVVYRAEVQKIRQTLNIFEQILGGRTWLVGEALSPADLALALPLTIVERFGVDTAEFPGLQALAERLNKRTSILAARKAPTRTPE